MNTATQRMVDSLRL